MRELLEQHRPKKGESDLRGFEWHYLYRLSHPYPVTVIKGHVDVVLDVAYSPDGKYLASASSDGMVKVWDVQTGQELFTIRGTVNSRSTVAFSPDGKRLAIHGKVWDAQTCQELLTLIRACRGGQ